MKYDIMEKQAYALVEALKSFRIYVFHSEVIGYVPLASLREILIQPNMDGRRSKWIAKILEFVLEIRPTKLVKGQGLAKILVETNGKSLGVNFINACSENQQGELSDTSSQAYPPLAECAWYMDIIFFLQKLHPPDGMEKRKVRDLNIR
jgi:hypothetical protein